MGIVDHFKNWASRNFQLSGARRKNEPDRDTVPYARSLHHMTAYQRRVLLKPTPRNLRYFSRTPYARQAIMCIRDPLCSLEFTIKPQKDIQENRTLRKQAEVAMNCFQNPNSEDNWRSFLSVIVEDWLVCGAGVFEQQLGNDSLRPLWMWPVDAQSIQIYPAWSGDKNEARYYQHIGYGSVSGGGDVLGRQLRNDEIGYIKANPSTETPYGYGKLEIAFETINRYLGVAKFASNLASNAQPNQMLYFKDADERRIKEFRNYWKNEIEGQGVTPMWGGKNEPSAITLHSETDDALYLQYQEFIIREIATAFGLSPMNMGIEKDVNRSTASVTNTRDWENTVIPLAEIISSYLTRNILHAKLGFYQLEFKFDGLYREDEEKVATIFQTYYKNNAITPNEHRAELGKPPMDNDWGDKTFADFQIELASARGMNTNTNQPFGQDEPPEQQDDIKNKGQTPGQPDL